jgi:hypothetical protein
VAAARAGELRGQITAEEAKLRTAINDLTAKGQAIDLREVAGLVQRENAFAFIRGLDAILSDDAKLRAIEDARSIAEWLAGEGQGLMLVLRATTPAPGLADLAKILELQRVLAGMPALLVTISRRSASSPALRRTVRTCWKISFGNITRQSSRCLDLCSGAHGRRRSIRSWGGSFPAGRRSRRTGGSARWCVRRGSCHRCGRALAKRGSRSSIIIGRTNR